MGLMSEFCLGRLWTFFGPALHLDLATKDGAPLLVFSHRHPALDADPNAGLWWLGPTQQSFQ